MPSTYIYGLIDPRSDEIRYIGKANDVAKRYGEHCRDLRGSTRKINWIKKLHKLGLAPRIFVLEEVDDMDWQDAEMFWIDILRGKGISLVNGDNGGLGSGRLLEETRRKIGHYWRGRRRSEENRRNLSLAKIGHSVSSETKKRISLGNADKKKRISPETREKMSARMRGNKYCVGTKNHCKKHSEESKRKMSLSHKGKQKGVVRSPEFRAKVSKSIKEWWRKRKQEHVSV